MMKKLHLCAAVLATMFATSANAQLSSNPNKFLGNITTSGQVDWGNERYYTLWNQITPENETKWASVEGSRRGQFNWGSVDNIINYSKQHHFPFKWHTLIWGSQYPGWMDNLSTEEQYKAIVEWFDAIKARYPDLQLIDVVNEAIAGHAPAPYKNALGGDGQTGYDWIIKAFEMAHERWPDAILIYNDYNTFQWQKTEFINLVKTLIYAGAPIDAYGCQSHDLTDMNVSSFKSAMKEIQNALKIPMYSTEYDIGTNDDALQLQRFKEQIPYMWEADYCAGITLWGYIYGHTWTTDGNSGMIRDGQDRPSMKWLREYMQTEAAKNATSPFEGGCVKEASIYIKATPRVISVGDTAQMVIDARLKTKQIHHIDFYVGGKYYTTLYEPPFVVPYVATATGTFKTSAILTATDSTKYTRPGGFTVFGKRTVYNGGATLPGILQFENFDGGGEGFTFHDSDTKDEGGTRYRTDNGGVDIVTGNGGYAIGYTSSGEWLEYTVNILEDGYYQYDATVSSGVGNSSFSMSLSDGGVLQTLIDPVTVPSIQSSWDRYSVVTGRCAIRLPEGKHTLRMLITGSSCNLDKIQFTNLHINPDIKLKLTTDPKTATIDEPVNISVENLTTDIDIDHVDIFVNDQLLETSLDGNYIASFVPDKAGIVTIKAIAYDAKGDKSDEYTYTLIVNSLRAAFASIPWAVPGVFEAEDFDIGGEGFTYHSTDFEDAGGNIYRSDNGGIDIIAANDGYVVSNLKKDEWLEYSINVAEEGKYVYEIVAKRSASTAKFTLTTATEEKTTTLTSKVSVKDEEFQTVHGTTMRKMPAGQQIFRITVNEGSCDIDRIVLKPYVPTGIEDVADDNAQIAHKGVFDLQGRRIANGEALINNGMLTGVYIVNGKKMLLK